MKTPVISVIMPAFNAGKTLAASIQSVQGQTLQDWELIVIDDGSRDDTAAIAKEFEKEDARIILLQLSKNAGLPNARNQGCRKSAGEFIAFLDSDDLWHADKLKQQLAFHRAHPDVGISHTAFEEFNESGPLKRRFKQFVDKRSDKAGYLFPELCYRNSVGVLTVMIKKELFFAAGLFDASLYTFEDHDLWIRVAKLGAKFGYLDATLAYYRISPGGISKQPGKYKKAYKRFIQKLLAQYALDKTLLWRFYYRYFGTIYFHKGNFYLARLYFKKSIQLRPFDYLALTTYAYLFLATMKMWRT